MGDTGRSGQYMPEKAPAPVNPIASNTGRQGTFPSPGPVASSTGNPLMLPPAPAATTTKNAPYQNPANRLDQAGVGETIAGAAGSQLLGAPGASEANWNANGSKWGAPTQSGGYWEGVAGQFNGGGPMVSNNAQGAYDTYMKQMPTIAPEANVGSFYDNARKRQSQDMNTEMGSRGAFNSSAALDKLAQGNATLNAEQANAESKYGLDRASAMGDLFEIGGTMARGADESSSAGAQSKLDYLTQGGALAGQADDAKLGFLTGQDTAASHADKGRTDRLVSAATAALGAQGAHDDRVQTFIDNTAKLGDRLSQVSGDAFQRIIGGDQALMDAVLSGDVARVAEALQISNDDANRITGDLKAIADVAVAASKAGAK